EQVTQLGPRHHPDDADSVAVAVRLRDLLRRGWIPQLRKHRRTDEGDDLGHHRVRRALFDLYGGVLPCRDRLDREGPVGGRILALATDAAYLARGDLPAGRPGDAAVTGQLGDRDVQVHPLPARYLRDRDGH